MANDNKKIVRVQALLSERQPSPRQIIRQVTHDINGPLFAFTLDLDLISQALQAANAALSDGDHARAREALDASEASLLNLQSANKSAADYVRGIQALGDESGESDESDDRR